MLSKNLRRLRHMHGLSQEQVAERAGVSRQAVAKWERGDSTPDLSSCQALAALYNVTLDDLVNFSGGSSAAPVPQKGKYLFGVVRMGDRGQIVIPKKAREVFGLVPGDELVVLGDESQGIAVLKARDFLAFSHLVMEQMRAPLAEDEEDTRHEERH